MLWDATSILNALYGGLLIGIAVSILLVVNGKVAGISGILGQALTPSLKDQGWRFAFLCGLVLSPLTYSLFHMLPASTVTHDYAVIIIGGLLVGFGTRLSNGCTSGHGVCGIARFSIRSIVATLTFMGFGILTVFFLRHLA